MTGTFIEDLITPVEVNDLMLALHRGYVNVLGAATDRAQCLAALGAQLCLESGNGQKAHRYNFGNAKRSKDWDGLFTRFRCDELFDLATATQAQRLGPCSVSLWKDGPLRRVVLFPPHPWSEFVAFESAVEGAQKYVELLALRDRYRPAWSRAFAGDAAGFSRELGKAHYYTAEVEAYTKGLVSIAKRILPACERVVVGEFPGLMGPEVAMLDAIVMQTAFDSVGRVLHGEDTLPNV